MLYLSQNHSRHEQQQGKPSLDWQDLIEQNPGEYGRRQYPGLIRYLII
jgi:hypothetical protein